MCQNYKIEQYGLQKRTIELWIRYGFSYGEIARQLTRETGIPISKCAVFRWLTFWSQVMRRARNNVV